MASNTGRHAVTADSVRVPVAARVFAASGWVAAIVGAIGAISIRIVDPAPFLPDPFGFSEAALVGFEVMGGAAYASVGALLVVRRPDNAIGWHMVLIGVGYALGGFAAAATFSFAAMETDSGQHAAQVTGWLAVLFTSLGGLVFVLGFIFPTGRGHTPGWDRLLRLFAITWPVGLSMIVFQPGPLNIFPTIENPIGLGPDLRPALGIQFSRMAVAALAILMPVLLWSLVSRYRLAGTTERHQLKWFALAIAASIGAVSVAGLGAVVSDGPPKAGLALFGFAGALVPVAIGIAILRYRLYDIDRIISRTVGYAVVSVILGAVFLVGVFAGQAVFSGVVGDDSTVAVAASTLIAFALFQPLRRRVQATIDRRFNRARIDAERTTDAFATRLRDQLDLATLTDELRRTAARAVEPVDARVWLRGHRVAR